ncbi:TetR/AcrR family transcriptional regulator [Mycobacterium sp. MUNTM1]
MIGDISEEQPTLRDRQRAAIRAELRRAAHRLFTERGYDAVSVDDIAAAAGLSRRTLFRHVASKEDLLLDPLRHGGAAIATLLDQQPADISPDTALINAIVARATAFEDTETQGWRAAVLRAPGLLDKVTMVNPADRERIVKAIADRMGAEPEPATDLRPGLLVQLAFAAGDFGFQQWIRQPLGNTKPLHAWVQESLQGIVGAQWRRPLPN